MIRPPIISIRDWQIDNPSPVPPKRRVMVASAWLKRWNSMAVCCGSKPTPVSCTSRVSHAGASAASGSATSIRTPTEPEAVNLTALLSRLASTWRMRVQSPRN